MRARRQATARVVAGRGGRPRPRVLLPMDVLPGDRFTDEAGAP